MDAELKQVIETARTDPTIPTIWPAMSDCETCKDQGRCICWSWQDEAEFRHDLRKI